MGCGSNIGQVAEMGRQGGFRPLKLLQLSSQSQLSVAHGKMFLFGETRTQRKIIQCDFKTNFVKNISTRTRIPIPKIHLDPVQTFYEQSQEVFNLGIYGSCMNPPFNKMLALFMQSNLVFVCGGCDFDHYNIKNEAFYYSIIQEPTKISSQMMHSSELSERTLFKPKYSKNKFQKMASMKDKRYSHTGMYSTKLKSILVFGGIGQDEKAINSCEMYSIWQNAWKDLPPMKIPRANASCFQYGTKVYVFGGRTSKHKLTKKIEVLTTSSNQWQIINFKLHRGVESPLVFSPSVNQILIVGGRGHYETFKTTIKINLSKQTYVWDSQLSHEYSSAKGVQLNNQFFVFGGKRDFSEIYFHKKWKQAPFEHRKIIQLDDLQNFSLTKENLLVKSAQIQDKQPQISENEEIFFGNDIYPCVIYFNKNTGKIKKEPIPLAIKLKSNMGIIEYEKDQFMLIGGSDSTEHRTSRSCYFYNKQKRTAIVALKMSRRRCHFAVVYFKNYIYVFGGLLCEEKKILADCQKFNLLTDKWEEIQPLSSVKYKPKAQLLGNQKIAIIAERNDSFMLQSIEIYDTKADKYQVFDPKEAIRGVVRGIYAKRQFNSFYLLRQDQDGDFLESKIILLHQKKNKNGDKLPLKGQLETIAHQKRQETIKVQIKPEQKSVQRQKINQIEDSDEQNKLPRIKEEQPVVIETQMIAIKERKKYAEDDDDEEQSESDRDVEKVEIQKISFESDVIEEIRKSTRRLVEQTVKEIAEEKRKAQMQKQNEESEEKHVSAQDLVQPLKIENKYQSERQETNILNDLSKKSDQPQNYESVYEVKDTTQNYDKLIPWIKERQHKIVRRKNETYYLSQGQLMTYNLQNFKQESTVPKLEHQIKMLTLS